MREPPKPSGVILVVLPLPSLHLCPPKPSGEQRIWAAEKELPKSDTSTKIKPIKDLI